MKSPEISVIVPVHQAEDFLEECVDSILRQTFREFECILVDDGSLDRCPQICDAYAQKDGRVRVIHQKNGGVSSARNAGMDAAVGRYLEFVDADDWIDERLLETQLRTLREHGAQIAQTTVRMRTPARTHAIRVTDGLSRLTEIIREQETGMGGYIGWESVGSLYDAAVLRDVRFPPIRIGEDMAFMAGVYSEAPRVVIFDEEMYVYRQQPDSAMHRMFRQADPDIVVAVERVRRIAEARCLPPDDVLTFCVNHLYIYFCTAARRGENAQSPYMRALRGFLRANYRRIMAQKRIGRMEKLRLSELALLGSVRLPFRKADEEERAW